MQDQTKKIAVLADLYLNYRDEVLFKTFADYHDNGTYYPKEDNGN